MTKKTSDPKPGRSPVAVKTKPSPKGIGPNGRTIRTPLTQNPHAIRDTREKVLEVAIGHEVRAFRKKLGITVADLAAATDISLGMLSKIENGITSPSLTTLQALSRA
ncbi:XRE family transcriptional regulator, partial [Mesorhizobium sp. M00.F.Ca.ET.170.01.1.1]